MPHVLRAPLLTREGFSHGFSTRRGGVSRPPFESLNLATHVGDDPAHVAENQRRFAAWLGSAQSDVYTLSQVHGAQVVEVAVGDAPEAVRLRQGDALLAPGGLALGIRSADCVPVLIADPVSRWVAAAHAGWRGVVAGVVPATVQSLCAAAAAEPSRLCAAYFPHIRSCCFEVDASVAAQLQGASPGGESCVRSGQRGGVEKPHVALDTIVRAQLMAAGLDPGRIEDVAGCTCCDDSLFFSYRRDGAHSGRHLTAIVG